ncbi:MAG TPA: S8 family serine peptidase [Roseiflexaceae bacterium]|nr:S8 family serine peptidase [Roseiflexaceae bacterium]
MINGNQNLTVCPLCGASTSFDDLTEANWLDPQVVARIAERNPGWQRSSGACPACIQQVLLQALLEKGDAALHNGIQSVWPLDAEAAFGAIPTPLRMHADPRFAGRGVTIALLDSGFSPHPDLTIPRNRIRAWVDASREPLDARRFGADETPRWPGWDAAAAWQWHGLMTSAVAAGNGALRHGLYRGLASEAELVLIQVRDAAGHITNESIARALHWLHEHSLALGVRVVSMSVSGDAVEPLAGNPVDEAVTALVADGVVVVAAAGNDGVRRLVPPATAPHALTIGGLDDMNTLDHAAHTLWHSNYGSSGLGALKPELVAPSIWVVAPLLPGTTLAADAIALFERRARGDITIEGRIAEAKLVTPHYQHVDGTSFAAPLVAGTVACMIEANPSLTPALVRDVLLAAAHPVAGAPLERQGAGALEAGRAVALALREQHGALVDGTAEPRIAADGVAFVLHEHDARSVQVLGSWDGWRAPGLLAEAVEPGIWRAMAALPPGQHVYKFLLDGVRWLDDPANVRKAPDGLGGLNSLLRVT